LRFPAAALPPFAGHHRREIHIARRWRRRGGGAATIGRPPPAEKFILLAGEEGGAPESSSGCSLRTQNVGELREGFSERKGRLERETNLKNEENGSHNPYISTRPKTDPVPTPLNRPGSVSLQAHFHFLLSAPPGYCLHPRSLYFAFFFFFFYMHRYFPHFNSVFFFIFIITCIFICWVLSH